MLRGAHPGPHHVINKRRKHRQLYTEASQHPLPFLSTAFFVKGGWKGFGGEASSASARDARTSVGQTARQHRLQAKGGRCRRRSCRRVFFSSAMFCRNSAPRGGPTGTTSTPGPAPTTFEHRTTDTFRSLDRFWVFVLPSIHGGPTNLSFVHSEAPDTEVRYGVWCWRKDGIRESCLDSVVREKKNINWSRGFFSCSQQRLNTLHALCLDVVSFMLLDSCTLIIVFCASNFISNHLLSRFQQPQVEGHIITTIIFFPREEKGDDRGEDWGWSISLDCDSAGIAVAKAILTGQMWTNVWPSW